MFSFRRACCFLQFSKNFLMFVFRINKTPQECLTHAHAFQANRKRITGIFLSLTHTCIKC